MSIKVQSTIRKDQIDSKGRPISKETQSETIIMNMSLQGLQLIVLVIEITQTQTTTVKTMKLIQNVVSIDLFLNFLEALDKMVK